MIPEEYVKTDSWMVKTPFSLRQKQQCGMTEQEYREYRRGIRLALYFVALFVSLAGGLLLSGF